MRAQFNVDLCVINPFILTGVQFSWENIGIKTRVDKNKRYFFDPIRKKYLMCTPEEEVRQFLIYELCNQFGYPINTIAVEREIKYNGLKKRFDVLVYKDSKPILLIECKAPKVPLTNLVFEQVSAYNHVIDVPYLLVSNGNTTIVAHIDTSTKMIDFLKDIPEYHSLHF